MPEPVAAVHWLDAVHGPLGDGIVVVYDLGASSLDVAVLRTGAEPEMLGRPLSSVELSGDMLDHLVTTHVLDAVGDATGNLDVFDPVVVDALAELRARCRAAKEELSADTEVVVAVELPGVRRDVRLVRDEVEDLARGPVRDSLALISEALRTADIDPSDVSRVLLVGGGSSIPIVAESISFCLGLPVTASAHPADTAATGAGIVSVRSLTAPGAVVTAPDPTLPVEDAITTELSVVPPPPGDRAAFAVGEPVEPQRSKARKFTLIGAAAVAIVIVTGGGLAVGTLTTSAGAESTRSSTVVTPSAPTTAGEPTAAQVTAPGDVTHAAATASAPATPGSAVPVRPGTTTGTVPAVPGGPAPQPPAPPQPVPEQPAPQQPAPAPTTTRPPAAPQPSGGGVGDEAAVTVGGLGQRDHGGLTADGVALQGRVADREHVGVAGALGVVDEDPPSRSEVQTGLAGQAGCRGDADGGEDQVARDQGVVVETDRIGGDLGGGSAGPHVDTVVDQTLLHDGGHLGIEGGQDLVGHLHEGDREPPADEVLGQLQADEPAAEHRGRAGGSVGERLHDGVEIGDISQAEGAVEPGEGRAHRGSPGGEDQRVVGLLEHHVEVQIADGDHVSVPVDGFHLVAHTHLEAEPSFELGG